MAKRVTLSTSQFEEALINYLDETKPDPLAKKQGESWTCEWTEDENDSKDSKVEQPSKSAIQGTLALQGDFITVLLRVENTWEWQNQSGCLELVLGARARFRTKSEVKHASGICASSTSYASSGKDTKSHANMLKRFRQDDYIAKLLKDEFTPLCQANVVCKDESELEERVWIDQNLLESIRRCIYSHADSALSVVELVTAMPYCFTPGCPLGHRAKLRLLEDAMLDACEQEGEDELIDELSLNKNASNDNDHEEANIWDHVPKRKKRR